jgi:hypothetical protein
MAEKILQPKNQKRGRPKTGVGTPIQVRVRDDQLAAIDGWRRDQADLPSRAEAIRRLVEDAIVRLGAKPRKR